MITSLVISIAGMVSVDVVSSLTIPPPDAISITSSVQTLFNLSYDFNGIGVISKPVTVNTTGIAKNRLVRCFSYDTGFFVRAGFSDNAGNITFNKLNQTLRYTLVAYDNTGLYADVILSPVTPV